MDKLASDLLPIFIILGTVFVTIGIVFMVFVLLKLSRHDGGNKSKGVPEVTVSDEGDGAIIAAISAAIAACLMDEAQREGRAYNGFKVVSFKRSSKGKAWTDR